MTLNFGGGLSKDRNAAAKTMMETKDFPITATRPSRSRRNGQTLRRTN